MKFLRENWIWILLPILVAALGLYFLISGEAADPTQEFIYNVG